MGMQVVFYNGVWNAKELIEWVAIWVGISTVVLIVSRVIFNVMNRLLISSFNPH